MIYVRGYGPVAYFFVRRWQDWKWKRASPKEPLNEWPPLSRMRLSFECLLGWVPPTADGFYVIRQWDQIADLSVEGQPTLLIDETGAFGVATRDATLGLVCIAAPASWSPNVVGERSSLPLIPHPTGVPRLRMP